MRRKICTCAFFCALALVAWIATLLLSGVVVCVAGARELRYGANVEQVGDYVFASGTWVIEGEKQTFPLQTTEMQCDCTLLRCLAATAQIEYGSTQ